MITTMKKTLTAGILALAASGAQAVMIDTFDNTGPVNESAPQNLTNVGVSTGGFNRLLTSITSGTDTNVQIDTVTNPGVYAHSQSAGVTGRSQIDFDLGGLDLTEGGTQNALRVELAFTDLNGLFGVVVDGIAVSITTNAALIANNLNFPVFGDFVFTDFAGVDFSNVQTVSVFIDGQNQPALDASIDSIGTTCTDLTTSGGATPNNVGTCTPQQRLPSPAPLALMAAGLLGFVGIRRLRSS